jgi:hypothetical protein
MTAIQRWGIINGGYENSLFCSDTSNWFRPIMTLLFKSYVDYLEKNEICRADTMTLICYNDPIFYFIKEKYTDSTGKYINAYLLDQETGKNKHCIQQLTYYDYPNKTLFKLQKLLARTCDSKYDDASLKLLDEIYQSRKTATTQYASFDYA